jgi:hypothetical protein
MTGSNWVRAAFGVAILFGVAAATWSLLWLVPAVLFVEAIIFSASLQRASKKGVDRR